MASLAPFGNYYLIVTTNDNEQRAIDQIIKITRKYRKIPLTQIHKDQSNYTLVDWWLTQDGRIVVKNTSVGISLCKIIDAKVLKMNSKAPKSKKRN